MSTYELITEAGPITHEDKGHLEVEDRGAVLIVRVDGGPHSVFGLDIANQLKCFPGVHAAWLSSSLRTGCWSGANGLPIWDSTWSGVIVRAHRSASATRSSRHCRWWVWVTARRKARHSHSMRLASGS